MRRREFLRAGATALAVPAVAAPAVAQSVPEIKWRLTSSYTKSHDTALATAQLIARNVAEATDGKFQIQVYAAGEVVAGVQALDAVTSGAVECAHTPTFYYFAKDPTLGFGTGLPFGLNSRHQQAWWLFGGGAETVNAALQKLNAYGIPAGNFGTQMGGWFRKEVNTLEDLKGLKLRVGGIAGQVLARLGVVPQQIPTADIYAALERGTLDAAEFIGPYDDERLGLSRVARHYYYPGWWEGGSMVHLLVNLERWNALPKHYKAVLTTACNAAHSWMLARYDSLNAAALRRLTASGTIMRPFPQSVMEAAYVASKEHFAEIAAKDQAFRKALESLYAFRREQLHWWQFSEHAFDSFMISSRKV